jgi:hypothetical protein
MILSGYRRYAKLNKDKRECPNEYGPMSSRPTPRPETVDEIKEEKKRSRRYFYAGRGEKEDVGDRCPSPQSVPRHDAFW